MNKVMLIGNVQLSVVIHCRMVLRYQIILIGITLFSGAV